jgi:hypothetical protein
MHPRPLPCCRTSPQFAITKTGPAPTDPSAVGVDDSLYGQWDDSNVDGQASTSWPQARLPYETG